MSAVEPVSEPRGEREALGSRLVHAREARGLSAEQVARSLKLSLSQIRALEAGEYAKLPGNTYVRGYLRSYSRLLGLAEKEVLDAHTRATVQPAPAGVGPVTPQRPAQKPRELKAGDRPVRLVSYIIAFGLAALLVAWWQAREETPPATAPVAAVPQPGAGPEGFAGGGIQGPAVVAAPQGPVSGDAATETPGAGFTGMLPQAPAGVDAPGEPQAGDIAREPVADTPATPQVAGPGHTPTVPGELEVVLRYRAECWTDVRDARGERLVYRTVAPGSVLRIHGAPPLRFFFGNAAAVDVEFAGKAYDLAPHVRGVFARFSLPASGAGGSEPR